jgi:molecular chaperone GrpE
MPDEREVHEQQAPMQTGPPAAEHDGPSTDGRPAGDELAQARAQAADYEDRWKRSVAELINYKRRTEQERGEANRYANAQLILELLPVLDDLERALASVPPDQARSQWVEGVRLVERKFRSILERQGLTSLEAIGQPFDPALHESVGGGGTHVTEEYQRGYQLHGRTLRPAMVVVGDAPAGDEERRARSEERER